MFVYHFGEVQHFHAQEHTTIFDWRVSAKTCMRPSASSKAGARAPPAAAARAAAKAAVAAEARVAAQADAEAASEQLRAAAMLSRAGQKGSEEDDEEEEGAARGAANPGYSSDAAMHPFAVQQHGSMFPTVEPLARAAIGGDCDILQDELVNAISPENQLDKGVKRACAYCVHPKTLYRHVLVVIDFSSS